MVDDTATQAGAGLTLGGTLAIAGVVIAIFLSLVVGIIVGLIGLVGAGAGESHARVFRNVS